METVICKKCLLNDRIPGIAMNENGICNICRKDLLRTAMIKYQKAMAEAGTFFKSDRSRNRDYDCLLMLSGGKDSIYMLNRLVKKGYKVLAFTFNHVYESPFGIENAKQAAIKLNTAHRIYTPDAKGYRSLMKKVLNQESSEALRYNMKAPCSVCNALMDIAAYITAVKEKIPYILYCADPYQIMTFSKDITELIHMVVTICSEECLEELFDMEVLEEVIHSSRGFRPEIIFPYAGDSNYNGDNIVKELKLQGLLCHEPQQTHCRLWSLLNYYSYRHFDTFFYAEEISSEVRNGQKDREELIHYFDRYREIIMKAALQEALSEEDKEQIRRVIEMRYPELDIETVEQEYENIIKIKEYAKDLGVVLI